MFHPGGSWANSWPGRLRTCESTCPSSLLAYDVQHIVTTTVRRQSGKPNEASRNHAKLQRAHTKKKKRKKHMLRVDVKRSWSGRPRHASPRRKGRSSHRFRGGRPRLSAYPRLGGAPQALKTAAACSLQPSLTIRDEPGVLSRTFFFETRGMDSPHDST